MRPRYLSLAARVLVNVEALNAVEALGNIIRHRKATLVIERQSGHDVAYEIVKVPAASGEMLRHAYQSLLADIAHQLGLPVCEWCRRHEFIKSGVEALIERT